MTLAPDQSILNKYRIVKLVGKGGMARVWLAEEFTFDGRRVAIKEPKAGIEAEDAADVQRRFQQEISLTAALMQAHAPNIVPAWTVEPLDGGRVLVMQYMPGGSLEELLRRPEHAAGLPVERAVAIALDVLGALEALHRLPAEPVHRDVKPSNILFDREGRACLADFGLAQLPGVSGRSRLAAGAHPATPMYAAPEQLRSPEPLSPAADLFALGCVLWEMLTGQRYKRSKPGTPPSYLRADVPAWLDKVVMRALAEDAWERWQGAGEMAGELREGLAVMQRAQQAAEARRLAEEQAQQAAAARRAAEEQARQEASRRAQAEAAERARREEEERRRQQQLAALFAEAKGLVEQQPAQALALLAQIRSSDPAYPGLTRVERRARKAEAKSQQGDRRGRSWRGRAAGIVALMVVGAITIWGIVRFSEPSEDTVVRPTATPKPSASLTAMADVATPSVFPNAQALPDCRTCTDPKGCVTVTSNESIRIAWMFVIAGPDSALGTDTKRGVEIAQADRPVVAGHRVELTAENEGCNAEDGRIAGTRVASDPQVVAAIGTSCSSAARAAIPLLFDAGIPMVSPSNVTPDLTAADRPAKYAFYMRTAHNNTIQGAAMAKYAYDAGFRNAATIHDGSFFADQLQQVFADEFKKLGGTIVAQEATDPNETNMGPMLTRIAAARPDFIYLPIFIVAGSQIASQAKQNPNLARVQLASADGTFSPDFLAAAGAAAHDFLWSAPDFSAFGGGYQDFLAKHWEKYGEAPLAPFHAHAYDAYNLIADAIEQVAVDCGDGSIQIGRQTLRDAMISTKDLKGLTGTLTCTSTGDCADPKISVYEVVNADPASWNPGAGVNSNPRKLWSNR